ncbi:DUF3905 domain-containing protein [Bacillus horti]|uniref:Uncharacterized protein n=1 Tax=Caldalkalibacillus horti TaxID=77523 RepID=A0ABT9VUI2_9BACI|nr:DUF3905 domain-containing protein [Bacillus horti]MDQ0164646.1 hypothetical protein [Bacillus horti]
MKKNKKYYKNIQIPLDQWNKEIDPAIMSGQHWEKEGHSVGEVDSGWATEENQELLEGKPPMGGIFMHPVHDVTYDASTVQDDLDEEDGNGD